MKKKIVVASIAATLMFGSNVYAEDALQYGQEVEIQTDSGNYKITIDKVVENNQLNDDDKTVKVVCVDCLIENVDYENYDNQLGSYDVGKGAVALLDADGISAEFYNIDASSDDGYELYATIKPGEKKRVALPFFVPEDTESVTVRIDSKYEISQNLSEEGNKASTEETQENDVVELQKQIETLEAENNDLKAENEALKKENEKLKNSEKNQEETPTPEPTEAPAEETPTPEPTAEPTEEPAQEEAAPETEQKPVVEYKDATTVRIVQQALNDAGYNCGNPDGVVGGKTTEAVTKYQTDKGLTVNGLVTDELLQSLNVVEKVQDAVQKEESSGVAKVDDIFSRLEDLGKNTLLQVTAPFEEDGVRGYVINFKNTLYTSLVNPDNKGKISIFIAPQEKYMDNIDSSEFIDMMAYMAQAFDSTLSSKEAYSVIADTINNESCSKNGYEYTFYKSLLGMTMTN